MRTWQSQAGGGWLLLDGGFTPEPEPIPDGYQLLYSTDFANNADGWVARQETQSNDNSYNHPDNVSYGSRGMVITGRREDRGGRPFTSGDVTGQHIQVPNYFRADVTTTLPTASGMWPCPLWFRPLNSAHGEIDVCETWTDEFDPPRFSVAIHRDYSLTPRHVNAFLNYSMLPNPDPAAPHVYTVIKTPDRMEFLCDGVRAYCWEKGATWNGTTRIGDVPSWWDTYMEVPGLLWYPRITLQIGGTEVSDPPPDWTESEVVVHSLRIYTPEGA